MTTQIREPKRSKYEKLAAVFDRFHGDIAELPDEFAAKLCENWHKAKLFYAQALASKAATRSQMASGMEQGLRDTPQILSSLPAPSRAFALKALAEAIRHEFPEFLERDGELLKRIRERQRIRNEHEYFLVRHRVDLLEEAGESAELTAMYALLEAYEAL